MTSATRNHSAEVGPVLKDGVLQKRAVSGRFKNWRTRRILLKLCRIEWYEQLESAGLSQNPDSAEMGNLMKHCELKGWLDLTADTIVERWRGQKNTVAVRSNGVTLVLKTEAEAESTEWHYAIAAAVEQLTALGSTQPMAAAAPIAAPIATPEPAEFAEPPPPVASTREVLSAMKQFIGKWQHELSERPAATMQLAINEPHDSPVRASPRAHISHPLPSPLARLPARRLAGRRHRACHRHHLARVEQPSRSAQARGARRRGDALAAACGRGARGRVGSGQRALRGGRRADHRAGAPRRGHPVRARGAAARRVDGAPLGVPEPRLRASAGERPQHGAPWQVRCIAFSDDATQLLAGRSERAQ